MDPRQNTCSHSLVYLFVLFSTFLLFIVVLFIACFTKSESFRGGCWYFFSFTSMVAIHTIPKFYSRWHLHPRVTTERRLAPAFFGRSCSFGGAQCSKHDKMTQHIFFQIFSLDISIQENFYKSSKYCCTSKSVEKVPINSHWRPALNNLMK